MLHYKNIGNCIEIYLKENGFNKYSAIVTYIPTAGFNNTDEEKEYLITLWLRHIGTNGAIYVDMQKICEEPIVATNKTIKNEIVKLVDMSCKNGFIQELVDEYERCCGAIDINYILETDEKVVD